MICSGGMWGFYNGRDRALGRQIFKKMTNKTIASRYHKSGAATKRGPDQFFLTDHVYPLIKTRSIVHDSYTCSSYKYSEAFPTQRIGSCFIGASGDQLHCEKKQFYECPLRCRPAEHKNWTYC